METLALIISIIGALLVICIIIMVHELGHYSVGRACKIKIVEFAVGFGPKIKRWVKNDIIYSIRWILLGGFTKFYGEDEDLDEKLAFNNQPAGRRALTIAAGPVFNILFAVVFAVIFMIAFGEYAPTVGEVWADSPAEKAGLQNGDVILSMNGVDMEFYMELETANRKANDEYVVMTVLRDGEEKSFEVQKAYYERIPEAYRGNRLDEEMVIKKNMAGFTFGRVPKSYGVFDAIGKSFRWTFAAFVETFFGILGIFSGVFTGNLPAGSMGLPEIVNQLSFALRQNFEYLMKLCAVINISLAVFNLLPLPALDGGRLVFIGIEKVFRKPVPRNVEGVIHFVGFVLLFGLMLFFVFRDVSGFFGG